MYEETFRAPVTFGVFRAKAVLLACLELLSDLGYQESCSFLRTFAPQVRMSRDPRDQSLWDVTGCVFSCREKRLQALCRPARVRAFFNAPVVIFHLNILSYFAFLCLFAYVLMVDFQPSPSWCEYLIYLWLFSLVCEETRQVLIAPSSSVCYSRASPRPRPGCWAKPQKAITYASTWELYRYGLAALCEPGLLDFSKAKPSQLTSVSGSMWPKAPHLPNHLLRPPLSGRVFPQCQVWGSV